MNSIGESNARKQPANVFMRVITSVSLGLLAELAMSFVRRGRFFERPKF
jgi:hypothetical protein